MQQSGMPEMLMSAGAKLKLLLHTAWPLHASGGCGQVFEHFLAGETLQECYSAVAAVANRWLDMLDTQVRQYASDLRSAPACCGDGEVGSEGAKHMLSCGLCYMLRAKVPQ